MSHETNGADPFEALASAVERQTAATLRQAQAIESLAAACGRIDAALAMFNYRDQSRDTELANATRNAWQDLEVRVEHAAETIRGIEGKTLVESLINYRTAVRRQREE